MGQIEVGCPRRTVLHAEKTVGYRYEEPVREVVTRLRMFPTPKRGSQRLLRQEVEVWPKPTHTRTFRDDFGNEVREFSHAVIAERLTFAVRLWTEHRTLRDGAEGRRVPGFQGLPSAGAPAFLASSPLADESEDIQRRARQFVEQVPGTLERAEAISRWVYQAMRFEAGVTSVDTPASAALAARTGVCQDYTHVMLALCRASGIPARYVSGFIPGEGYMHAWVEVLAKARADRYAHWMGFDPTHNRPTDRQYLAVAAGRDYRDISPISGSFYGSAPGRLRTWTRTTAQNSVPEIRIVAAPGGLASPVTERYPDGNIPVIQPGYSC